MYGYSGLGFAKSLAQTTSIQLAQAGADAAQFKDCFWVPSCLESSRESFKWCEEAYQATASRGQAKAIAEASKAAVEHDLAGRPGQELLAELGSRVRCLLRSCSAVCLGCQTLLCK